MRFVGLVVLILLPFAARAQSPLPDRDLTPGAINEAVTEQDIDRTICRYGWTATVRPPEAYTEQLKREQIREYGYQDRKIWHYEEDHLIPLDLGGSPRDPRNLWPEPHLGPGQWGSYAKDRLEARLVQLVCRGKMSLDHARAIIAGNWILAYQRWIGPEPNNTPRGGWHRGWDDY